MTHEIRPDVRTYLDALAAQPRPPMSDAVIAMIRQMPPGAMPSQDLPVGALGTISDHSCPGPRGLIGLRLYDPREAREPGPVLVFYHGGGFAVGNEETHGGLAAAIARGLDMPVVSVDYALAPEHKWPAGPDDCEAAARWVASVEGAAALGRTASALVLCGDSAGGNLAIVTAMALRDAAAPVPVALLWAIYPTTDRSQSYPSRESFSLGFGLDANDRGYFEGAYAADPAHWRASPVLGDLAGLPPMLLSTAGLDPLRDEGRAFAARAVSAGVTVSFVEYAGTIHGFATYRAVIPSARDDLADMVARARGMLARDAGVIHTRSR